MVRYGLGSPLQPLEDDVLCPECGIVTDTCAGEWNLITHLNNDHGFDFLTIANKMPDTEVGA